MDTCAHVRTHTFLRVLFCPLVVFHGTLFYFHEWVMQYLALFFKDNNNWLLFISFEVFLYSDFSLFLYLSWEIMSFVLICKDINLNMNWKLCRHEQPLSNSMFYSKVIVWDLNVYLRLCLKISNFSGTVQEKVV